LPQILATLDLGDVEPNARFGWVLIRRGKGLKERRIPLSLEVRKALRAYLEVVITGSGNAMNAVQERLDGTCAWG